MPDEPAAATQPPKPSTPTVQGVATVATLASAISGIGALLPGKTLPTVIGMLAPFLSAGIMWLVNEQANEWLAERKAQAPTRRAERYLRQMRRDYRRMKPADPARGPLLDKITELDNRLHAHKMSQLVLQAAPQNENAPAEKTTEALPEGTKKG